MNKNKIIILIAFCFYIIMLSINLNSSLALDERLVKMTFNQYDFPYNFVGITGQPPITLAIHSLSAKIIGDYNFSYRIINLLFALGTGLLTILIIWKKKGELCSVYASLLLLSHPWFLLLGYQVMQTSIATFFCVLTLYLLEIEKNKKIYTYSALSASLSFFSAFFSIGLFIAIGIYTFISKNQDFLSKVVYSFKKLILFPVFIISFMFLNYIFFPLNFKHSFSHSTELATKNLLPAFSIPSLSIFFLWAGPFLIFFGLLFIRRIFLKKDRLNIHLIFIIVSGIIFFLMNSDNYRPYERYFMLLFPSMIIYIIDKDWIYEVHKSIKKIGILFISFIGFFLVIPLIFKHQIIPLEPKIIFIKNFFIQFGLIEVPFSSNGGPIGFYVPGLIIAISWLLCLLLFIASFFNKRVILLLFVIILSSNLIISLYFVGLLGKYDVIKANNELVNIINEYKLKEPIFYYRNPGYKEYIKDAYNKIIYPYDENFLEILSKYNLTNYSIIGVDFPKYDESEEIWKYISIHCNLLYSNTDNNINNFIYECSTYN